MTIIIDTEALPEKGPVELKIERSFQIRVTASEARQVVNRWLLSEVSYLLHAGEPTLVVGEQITWRVPAILTLPHTGPVGPVSPLAVNIETGQIIAPIESKTAIERDLQALEKLIPAYKRRPAAAGQTHHAEGVLQETATSAGS